jgi:hypothetical protein
MADPMETIDEYSDRQANDSELPAGFDADSSQIVDAMRGLLRQAAASHLPQLELSDASDPAMANAPVVIATPLAH